MTIKGESLSQTCKQFDCALKGQSPCVTVSFGSVQTLKRLALVLQGSRREGGRRVFFVTRDDDDKETYGRVRAWLATDYSSPHEISLRNEVEL